MAGGAAGRDHEVMKNALVVAIVLAVGAGRAAAGEGGTLVVPVVSEGAAPVYCTYNRSTAAAAPVDGGGYRVAVAPGRYVVRLVTQHETIDVQAVVPAGADVVVPPVIARGRCKSVEVIARTAEPDDQAPMWSLTYGRSYGQGTPVRKAEVSWTPRPRRRPVKLASW